MAAPQKYAHIDFTPPAGARREAEQGLKLRREHGRGGTAVGIARARDISNGVELSPSTVRRMKAFFDRHASDSKAEGFRRGEKGWPSNGVIANKLWGGPAGYSWAKKVVAQMEAADARSTYSLDAETSTLEAGTDKRSTVIPNVERRFLGNFSESDPSDPDLLKVEERADPETGKKRTYLVGYAATFGKNSLLLGDFVERIAPTAFDIVEKRQDADGKPLETRCLFNHSPDNLLGRFPTTMRMWVDERGLRYECLLPETRRDIAELVARGDLKGSSFSFIVAEGGEKWTTEEGRSTRLVTRIKSLLDCGPVTYPAYDSATVAVAKRSYDQFVASKSPTAVVEKRDSGIAARVAEEARKTQEFLAERRGFCATGPGGGIDNSCGGKGGASSGLADKVVGAAASAISAVGDIPSGKTTIGKIASGYAKGATVGGLAGVVGGLGGVIAGSVTGGLIGAAASALHAVSSSVMKARMDDLKEKMKLSDDSLKTAADKAFGSNEKTTTAAIDKKTIAIEQGDSIALISDGSPFSKDSKGTSFYYQPGADKDGKFNLKAVEGAAKAVNAKSVSVEAWHDSDVKFLESKGYRQVAKSEYSSSKGIYEKTIKRSKRDIEELQSFLAERRGFCPTGEGGGIDNSCNAGGGGKGNGGGKPPSGGGSTGPKGDGGEKYKKSDDEDTDWLGRKTSKGPNWLGIDPKEIAKKVADSGGMTDGPGMSSPKKSDGPLTGGKPSGKVPLSVQAMKDLEALAKKKTGDGQSAGFKVHPKMGYDSGKPKGGYKEWEKGKDHLDKSKEKDAQDFLDKARADQLTRGGKDGGKSDDGGGVQTWSKGEHFPWTTKQVGTDEGYIQGQHPDGSKTAKYPFKGDPSEAHRKVIEEIKSKKRGKRSVTLAEMKSFFMERAG